MSSSTKISATPESIFLGHGSGDCTFDEQMKKSVNPMKILNLCANLSSYTTSINIQIILNQFLQDITNSPYVFIIPILSNYEECLIQVIGDKVLDKEMRLSISMEDIKNNAANGYKFFITELNRSFREVIEMLVGTENNTIIFDIGELNKNEWSILSDMIPLDEISFKSSATGLTNCSKLLDDDLTLPPVGNDGHLQISLLVCIAGDEACRIYYRYCIYETLRFTIGHLIAAIELDEGRRVRKQCQKLIGLSQNLLPKIYGEFSGNNYAMTLDIIKSSNLSYKFFYESIDFNNLEQNVLAEAEALTGAERCNLFLRDQKTGELVSNAVDGDRKNEFRIHEKSKGLVGYVADNGNLLNIKNIIYQPQYDQSIDEEAGSMTRNMLCFPICVRNCTIGVAELRNKFDSYHFDKRDEEVAKAFSTYTSCAIINSLILKSVQYFEANHKIRQELVIHHTNISDEEVNELVEMLGNLSENKIPDLNSFTFRTRNLDLKETFQASIQMFHDLDYINKFQIRPEKLARFLLLIQKGYRTLPFHNWVHAFTVAHFAYTLIMNGKLVSREIMSELEAFAFFISALCHDFDHRATTNYFHKESNDILAQLYSTEGSINERHHFAMTVHILNEDSANILDNLRNKEVTMFFDALKSFILSTDLANLFYILKQLQHLNRVSLDQNKHMAMSLLITCCDLCDQIKEWPTVKIVSEYVYKEFFAQGDLERQMGIVPKEMMDRQRAKIPRLQIEFIEDVVLPGYNILANIIPEMIPLIDIIKDNLEHWKILKK